MRKKTTSPLLSKYTWAITASVLALGLQFVVFPEIDTIHFLILYPTIFLIAWMGGFGPALLSIIISASGVLSLLFYPVEAPYEFKISSNIRVLFFVILSMATSWMIAKGRQKIRDSLKDASDIKYALDTSSIVAITDHRGRITFANNKFCEISKYPREELIGQDHRILNSGYHSKEFFRTLWKTISSGREWSGEIKNRAKDGSYYWVSTIIVPFLDKKNKPYKYVAIRDDITLRKEAEEALAASENRFRLLVEGVKDYAMFMMDVDGNVANWNISAERIEGYSQNEILGKHFSIFYCEEDILNQRPDKALEEARLKGAFSEEGWRIRKDGHRFWAGVSISRLEDESGKLLGFAQILRDLTEARKVSEALRFAKENAEAASKTKSQFLANMSHEIRSPLNSVLGYADLLSEKKLDEHARITYANRIRESGRHLISIIDDILDLSKVEAGELRIDKRKCSPVDLVTDCVQSASVLARQKNIEIRLSFENAIPAFIETDPIRLRQIIVNLLSNSIKFTDQGCITISVKCISKNRQGSVVLEFEFKDTGIGIANEHQDKLFQAFTQADPSITRRFGGTGLGLNLSRKLAQHLGGDLRLAWSELGKGSCFVLAIEAREMTLLSAESIGLRRIPEESKLGHHEDLANLNILLVEDSIDNQVLMQIFLRKEGANTEIASNGLEGVEKAMAREYDVILMDMAMPVLGGLEATKRLRKAGYRKAIIALTAHALNEEVERSMAAGCDAHLSKPVSRKDLVQIIHQVVHH